MIQMALEDDILFFRRIPTFRALGTDGLRVLAISAEVLHLRTGDVLFEEGEPADSAYAVQSGALKFRRAQGRAGADGQVAGPGTLIGESALIVDTQRYVTAIATAPSTLMKISRVVFMRMLEGDAEAAISLRDMIAQRIDAALDDLDLVLPRFETQERADE